MSDSYIERWLPGTHKDVAAIWQVEQSGGGLTLVWFRLNDTYGSPEGAD